MLMNNLDCGTRVVKGDSRIEPNGSGWLRQTSLSTALLCDDEAPFLLYPMRSMGESNGIGLAASSTSKGPQAKTTEPIDSIKVTYCSIQLG